MPNGSCRYLSGSWQHQSWRKLKEEKRWKGEMRRKSPWAVPPRLSHLNPEMWEQLLVVISFLLLGLNSVEGWEQQENQKETQDRTSAPIYVSPNLSQLLSWLLSIFTKSVVLVQNPFLPLYAIFSSCDVLEESSTFPSPVSSRPLFLLPLCHRCLIIYEVLKNLLCNQGYQKCESLSVKPILSCLLL